MFKSLVVATAIAQVAGTKIMDEDHQVKALNPKMIEEINVSVVFIDLGIFLMHPISEHEDHLEGCSLHQVRQRHHC